MSYYGPTCNNNVLSCVTYTNNNSCQLTDTDTIIEKTQNGGEKSAQIKYCFASSDECKNNIVQNFYCQNNNVNIKSKVT
jgi:hypothetical protein